VGGHARSGLGFDDARWELHLEVLVTVGRELFDADDVVAWIVVRVVVELVLGPVVTQLLRVAVVERRDGDMPL